MNIQFLAAALGIRLVRFYEYDGPLRHPVQRLPPPLNERLVEPVWWRFCWGTYAQHDRFKIDPEAALTNIWSRMVYLHYQRNRRDLIWTDRGFVEQRLVKEQQEAEARARVEAALQAEETRRHWDARQRAEAQKRAARKARHGGL